MDSRSALPKELSSYALKIADIARAQGLDFYETIFEVIDYDQMAQIAAYGGFPQRYPHWRFGMEYEKLRKQHTYGLGRIYEMVINNNPCYAYLLSDNSLTDQKLVMAHVYAHCDFFKNNIWFGSTNRKMIDAMANHSTRVRRWIDRIGFEPVERFLDVCTSLDNLIDAHSAFMKRGPTTRREVSDHKREKAGRSIDDLVTKYQSKSYMDRWINPPEQLEAQRSRIREAEQRKRLHDPAEPMRDVLLYLLQNAPLEDWQADILSIIREEAYYYAPQGQTKIMNEGWATYWHSRMMTGHILQDHELITYADHHSGTVAMPPGRINPYKIGLELFRDIEDRWNRGQFGKEYEECESIDERRKWDTNVGAGRSKIFDVRRIYNDVMFIDEFMTPEFAERAKLFHYRQDPATRRMVTVDREFDKIKQQMLFMLTNHGQPYIYVVDGNYANRGELYLAQKHNGVDLDIKYSVETLKNIQLVWQRPVHLQAMINDEMVLFTNDGTQQQQQKITEDMPKPAHSMN